MFTVSIDHYHRNTFNNIYIKKYNLSGYKCQDRVTSDYNIHIKKNMNREISFEVSNQHLSYASNLLNDPEFGTPASAIQFLFIF